MRPGFSANSIPFARTIALAIALGAPSAWMMGCDGGGGDEAGPSGTQLLPGRDFGNLFFWGEATPTLAFTRQTADGADQALWAWPTDLGAPLRALPQVDWSPPSQWYRLFVGDILMTGPQGELIYDLAARALINFKTAGEEALPYTPSISFASIRRDGGLILAYRYDDAMLVAGRGSGPFLGISPFVVKGVDFMGTDLAVLGSPGNDRQAPDGIYRIALPSGEVSPLPVPPFDAASSSANLSGLECLGFATSPCRLFRVLGCREDGAPCPETGRPPCVILYQRADAEARRLYAFDVATGQDQMLGGARPDIVSVSPDQHLAAWMSFPSDTGPTDLQFRDFCSGAAGQCAMQSPVRLTWRSDSGLLTIDRYGSKLGLVTFPGGQCSEFGGGTVVYDHLFSPANDRLAWLSEDLFQEHQNATLWIGDAQGNEPRLLAQGSFRSFRFSPDGQRMYFDRAVSDQLSLGWLSPSDGDPPVEHHLADMYSGSLSGGNLRALFIDRWNAQDGSGTLALVDLTSGGRQVIAQAVTEFAVNASVDGEARLVYAVHGRFASGRDGLWQMTLPAP